jgi:hypothetical protein
MCFCACVTLEFATQSRMFDTTIELYNCFGPIVPTDFCMFCIQEEKGKAHGSMIFLNYGTQNSLWNFHFLHLTHEPSYFPFYKGKLPTTYVLVGLLSCIP